MTPVEASRRHSLETSESGSDTMSSSCRQKPDRPSNDIKMARRQHRLLESAFIELDHSRRSTGERACAWSEEWPACDSASLDPKFSVSTKIHLAMSASGAAGGMRGT
jgi:hypothetical protein